MSSSFMPLALLLVMVSSFASANAQVSETLPIESDKSVSNGMICQYCEQFSSQALYYLKENKTQTEILSVLHEACAQFPGLRQQCITLVDYYSAVIFLDIAVITPEKFCEEMHLCKEGALIHLPTQGVDTCSACHYVIAEILAKLNDPDTQLEALEVLLKACNEVPSYVQQCKQLVLEYAPLILVNSEKFFEKIDICTAVHACTASKGATTANTVLMSSA